MINSLELFSGAGGLAKGLELAGARHKAFVEWNADACRTLRANYPPEIVHETDIREFTYQGFKDIDVIAGGPPCQPFSLGGKAKGWNDERDMFPNAIASIRNFAPKLFMFENVKGLLRASFSDYFRYIILQLTYPGVTFGSDDWKENLESLEKINSSGKYDGLKYKVIYKMVNAANYGVPQKRERVIIVGIRSDLDVSWEFPEETHSEDALLWDKYVTMSYWEKHNIRPNSTELEKAKKERERLYNIYGMFRPNSKPWVTVRDAISNIPQSVFDRKEIKTEHRHKEGAKEYIGHTGSDIDMPSKTIKAGGHGVPGGENMIKFEDGTVRYYTIFEAKRIQTFPDDYPIIGSWSEAMRQLGNAVPVKLAYVLSSSLFESVFGKSK